MLGISSDIIMNLYQKYKYNKIFTKKQIFGFCFLSELFLTGNFI